MNRIFSGWHIKRSIISPIIVNITTALTIFFAVLIFKTPLLHMLGIKQEFSDFPLYCTAEPFNYDEDKKVAANLYLINLLPSREVTENDLEEFIELRKKENLGDVSKFIKIKISDAYENEKIIKIKQDEDFNDKKGDFEVINVTENSFEIHVKSIEQYAIVKFVIYTSAKRGVSSRTSYSNLPIKVIYAGRMRDN